MLTILHSLHGFVQLRIEWLPNRIHLLDTSTFEGVPELFGDQFDTLSEGAAIASMCKASTV